MNWNDLPRSDSEENVPLKILLVADPQLIGEMAEMKYVGIFTRWDSDRFLHVHYQAAFNFLQPQVVIFLGDIFDEGSKGSIEQWRRYYQRFRRIFSLDAENRVRSVIIPGDNDIGGEKEPIYADKIEFFNNTFGDIQEPFVYKENGHNAQFLKLTGFSEVPGLRSDVEIPNIRIIITHYSCLKNLTEPCSMFFTKLLKEQNPSLILSAHSHQSTYYRIEQEKIFQHRVELFKHFLLRFPASKFFPATGFNSPFLRFNLHTTKVNDSGRLIHELTIPTCSYRMGIQNTGYGALQLFQNGTVDYTVLWLPSRFFQLYIYLAYCVYGLVICIWIWKTSKVWRSSHLLHCRWKQRPNGTISNIFTCCSRTKFSWLIALVGIPTLYFTFGLKSKLGAPGSAL